MKTRYKKQYLQVWECEDCDFRHPYETVKCPICSSKRQKLITKPRQAAGALAAGVETDAMPDVPEGRPDEAGPEATHAQGPSGDRAGTGVAE
jgi:ribosomal protein S27E